MRELGTMIDRGLDCLSPNRIAGLIGRSVGREAAGRKVAGLRNLLRALLAACEAVLILNMASCGNTYNGFELIRMTVRLEVSREYECRVSTIRVKAKSPSRTFRTRWYW